MIVILKYLKIALIMKPDAEILSFGFASAFVKGSLSLISILTTVL